MTSLLLTIVAVSGCIGAYERASLRGRIDLLESEPVVCECPLDLTPPGWGEL